MLTFEPYIADKRRHHLDLVLRLVHSGRRAKNILRAACGRLAMGAASGEALVEEAPPPREPARHISEAEVGQTQKLRLGLFSLLFDASVRGGRSAF